MTNTLQNEFQYEKKESSFTQLPQNFSQLQKQIFVKNIIIPSHLLGRAITSQNSRFHSPNENRSQKVPFKASLVARVKRENQLGDTSFKSWKDKTFQIESSNHHLLPLLPPKRQQPDPFQRSPQTLRMMKQLLLNPEADSQTIFSQTSPEQFKQFKSKKVLNQEENNEMLVIKDLLKEKERPQSQEDQINSRKKQIQAYLKLKSFDYNVSEEEVFALIRNTQLNPHASLKGQYFYFNKGSSPYDLCLTNFENKNPSFYYTISAHGVLQYNQGDKQLMSIARFEKEKKDFYKIKKNPFFAQFWEWKSFQAWKRLLQKQKMVERRKQIEQKLLILNPQFRKSILKIRKVCLEISEVSIVNIFRRQNLSSKDIHRFLNTQHQYLTTSFQKKIQQLSQKIRQIALLACQNSLTAFLNVHTIPSLAEASYTQRAILTFEKQQWTSFIRLVDFFHANSKALLLNCGIDSIVKMIDNMNSGRELGGIIKINGSLVPTRKDKDHLDPPLDQLVSTFEEIVHKDKNLSEFIIYDNSNSLSVDSLKKQMIFDISSSLVFKKNFKELQEVLSENYMKVKEKSTIIQKIRGLYTKYQPIQSNELEKYEAQEFSELFDMFLVDKKLLMEIEVNSDIGIFSLNHQDIIESVKQQLRLFYKNSFLAIEEKITQIAQLFFENLSEKRKYIVTNPETIEQYYVFLSKYYILEKERETDRKQMIRITQLETVCQQKKIILSSSLKQLLIQVTYSYEELTTKMDEIMLDMDSILFKYKITLDKTTLKFKNIVKTFETKNMNFLMMQRDLQDANFILQRLDNELKPQMEEIEGLKKHIQATQEQLEIEQHLHLNLSFYENHIVFLVQTQRFWYLVKKWNVIFNDLASLDLREIDFQVSILEIEKILNSRETNTCTITEIQDFVDLHISNAEISNQFFVFLQHFLKLLRISADIQKTVIEQPRLEHKIVFLNDIIQKQIQKISPERVQFSVLSQDKELTFGFVKKYLFNIQLDDMNNIKLPAFQEEKGNKGKTK